MKIRASKINKIILNSLLVAGFISVAMVAPNALQLFDPKKRPRLDTIKKAFKRLVYSGCIEVVDGKVYLTKKGNLILGGDSIAGFGYTEKWDKKWRVISFDIPENKRSARTKIRSTLSDIGFVRMQNSVWIYPYECKELISLIKEDFEMGKEVVYMISVDVENDFAILKHFKL